jgi:hypothetical protein
MGHKKNCSFKEMVLQPGLLLPERVMPSEVLAL